MFLRASRSIDFVYNIGYAAWEEPVGFTYNKLILFVATGLFLPLVMFNLLIAIISDTFERVEADKELIDIKGIIGVLLDYSYFSRVVRSLICSYVKEHPTFVHLAVSKQDLEREAIEVQISELEKELNSLEDELVDANLRLHDNRGGLGGLD